MNVKTLESLPPWEWPKNAGKVLHKVLIDSKANASERVIAAELAGDLVAMNDTLADALLAILNNADEPEELRAKAATSFGPVLEQAYITEFDDPEDVPITKRTYKNIQRTMNKVYFDSGVPKLVRRRILEGSVRSAEPWHKGAINAAYSTGDGEWMLTAVFAMRYVKGFGDQILESLKNTDPDIHCEAVQAAGSERLDAAWTHIKGLLGDSATPRETLFAAIDAAANIRPSEAVEVLSDLADSDDEEIQEAAQDAMEMANAQLEFEEWEDQDGEDSPGKPWRN